jgi:hypothetical protein
MKVMLRHMQISDTSLPVMHAIMYINNISWQRLGFLISACQLEKTSRFTPLSMTPVEGYNANSIDLFG